MTLSFEKLIARLWNRRVSSRRPVSTSAHGLDLGSRITDAEVRAGRVTIPHGKRAEHIAIVGRTGSGKSFELRSFQRQDILAGRGFIVIDLHGDTVPYLLSTIADHEKATKRDLSDRVIVVSPADPEASVGINPLEARTVGNRFVQIAEFAEILKQRWHLESFGARTDELLRNSLHVLAENGLTLVEIGILLSDSAFRTTCVRNLKNTEVKQYFELRYDGVSEPMRATMREPILNKISAFTADINFRHIVGQVHSTFSLISAMDYGSWVLFDLPKARLGGEAVTLAGVMLSMVKNALFARKTRDLFTIYADEIQNLVSYGSGLETILSESRKFSTSIVAAHQFLDQNPAEMRAAMMAIGTHIFFQLSSSDAQLISSALDGGKSLAELLKNLPRRHMVVKTGSERWQQAVAPMLAEPKTDPSDLYARSRARWARKRTDIERDIRERQSVAGRTTKESLDDWE